MLEWLSAALKQLLDWLAYAIGEVLGGMAAVLFWILQWVWDNLEHFLKKLAEHGARAFKEMLALIEVPDFISELESAWNAVPWSQLAYYLEPFEVDYGFAVITGAAVLKFSLRMIPFVGVLWRSPS